MDHDGDSDGGGLPRAAQAVAAGVCEALSNSCSGMLSCIAHWQRGVVSKSLQLHCRSAGPWMPLGCLRHPKSSPQAYDPVEASELPAVSQVLSTLLRPWQQCEGWAMLMDLGLRNGDSVQPVRTAWVCKVAAMLLQHPDNCSA